MDYCGFGSRREYKKQSETDNFCLVSDYSYLVEMAVIETASENPFTQLSPGAVSLLKFPSHNAEGQAL